MTDTASLVGSAVDALAATALAIKTERDTLLGFVRQVAKLRVEDECTECGNVWDSEHCKCEGTEPFVREPEDAVAVLAALIARAREIAS
jgi:hypothetical protein